MSISDIARRLDVGRNTISRHLDIMLTSGQVEMRPIGSAKIFFMSNRIPLSKLLDASSDLIAILDEDLMVIQANSRFAEYVGVEKEKVLGLNFRNTQFFLAPDSNLAVQMKEAFKGNDLVTELSLEGKTGVQYFTITLLPTILGNEKPGVCIVADNITGRKMIEAALIESQEMYRSIVHSMNDMVFVLDENNRFLQVHSSDDELLNATIEELFGRHLSEVMPAHIADEALELIRMLRITGNAQSHDIPLDLNDKHYWFSAIMTLHEDGENVVVVVRDITERKLAEESLRESESKYRNLIETLPQKIFCKNLDSVYVYSNNAFSGDFGLTSEEIVGKTDFDLHSKEDAEKYRSEDRQIMDSGDSLEKDEVIILKGALKTTHVVKVPVNNASGNIEGVLGIFWDITERRQIEQELQHSEERFKTIFEASPIGIEVFDSEGLFNHANRVCLDLFGVLDDDLLKRFKIFDDPNLSEEIKERMRMGETFRFENEFDFDKIGKLINYPTTKSGVAIHDAVVAPLQIDEHGRPRGYILQIFDITERKWVEKKLLAIGEFYHSILEKIVDGVWVTDKNDTIHYANKGMTSISGLSIEKLIGKNILKDFHKSTPERFRDYFLKAKRDLIPTRYDTVHFTTPTGQESFQSGWLLPQVKEGQYDGMICSVEDITEHKVVEDKIRKSKEFLETVIESLNHPFYIIDAENYLIKMANTSAALGQLTETSTCYSLTHLSDTPCNNKDHVCPLEEVKRKKKSLMVEHKHYNREGEVRYVEVHAHPIIDDEEKVTDVIEYVIDVTERKLVEKALIASEERYRELVSSASASIIIMNLDHTMSFANKSFADMLGYSIEEILSLNFLALIPPYYVKTVLKKTMGIIKGESSFYTLEMICKDGEKITVNISAVLNKDQNGEVIGTFGYITDITEHHKSIEELGKQLAWRKLVVGVVNRLLSSNDIEQSLFLSLSDIASYLDATRVFVSISNSEKKDSASSFEWCSQGTQQMQNELNKLFMNDSLWWRKMISQGKTINIPDVTTIPKEGASVKRILKSLGISSFVAFPMDILENQRGLFGIGISEKQELYEHELRMLQECKNIITHALMVKRMLSS